MDYIPLSPTAPLWLIFLMVTVGLFLVATSLILAFRSIAKGRELPWRLIGYISAMLTGIVLLAAGLSLGSEQSEAAHTSRNSTLTEKIRATYGIELSSEEISDLTYPSTSPASEFEVYGFVEIAIPGDPRGEPQEVYLVWFKDEMILAEFDGARGEEMQLVPLGLRS